MSTGQARTRYFFLPFPLTGDLTKGKKKAGKETKGKMKMLDAVQLIEGKKRSKSLKCQQCHEDRFNNTDTVNESSEQPLTQ